MGTLSTVIMFLIYVMLNHFFHYQISYLVAYIVTVALSYVLNSRFVFKTPMSLKTFLQFPMVYVVQYFGTALGLEVMVHLRFSVTLSPLIVTLLLMPLTYWLSRFFLVKK
jgi:putative flippase GtrA